MIYLYVRLALIDLVLIVIFVGRSNAIDMNCLASSEVRNLSLFIYLSLKCSEMNAAVECVSFICRLGKRTSCKCMFYS